MTKEEHNKIIDFVNSDDYMLLNSYISKPYEETIIEQDKEIERLKNGYCELKVKCNNGECDCTNEEYDGMVQANIRGSLLLDDYKSRNEKAMEYIKRHQVRISIVGEKELGFCDEFDIFSKPSVLLNILQGEDKDE